MHYWYERSQDRLLGGAGVFSGYSDEAYAAKGCKVCSRGDDMKQSEAGRCNFITFPTVFHSRSPFEFAQVAAEVIGVSYETLQLGLRACGFLGTQRGAQHSKKLPRGKWSQGGDRQGSDCRGSGFQRRPS